MVRQLWRLGQRNCVRPRIHLQLTVKCKCLCFLTVTFVLNSIYSAIDRLADFAGPLLSGMSQIMGMHCSLFVGGPEPRAQGKIRIIT